MEIVVHGLNHRTAPMELREQVAFLPDETDAALGELRERGAVFEVALLSTCNRTEFYALTDDPEQAVARQRDLVGQFKKAEIGTNGTTYVHRNRECVEHLFRVAGGIDSMVIGEPGILGQVKTAFETAVKNDAVGAVFGRLFPSALRVGKRSRSETGIARGAVSLAKAGIQLSEKIFGDLARRGALVVGAGETGEHTAMLLRESGVRSLVFANRTRAKAERLAEKYSGRVANLDELAGEIPRANILVTAVSARDPIVSEGLMRRSMHQRKEGPLLVIDLGVPRNVEPAAGGIENVFLYCVDDLQELVNLNLGKRRQDVPAVESIVREEADRFFAWVTSLKVTPVVVALREEAERVRQEALSRFARNVSDEEKELLERFSLGLLNKILHNPTVALRHCDPRSAQGLNRLEWTRQLFGIDDAGDERPE